jgi:alpha-glucoside transport system permease protein
MKKEAVTNMLNAWRLQPSRILVNLAVLLIVVLWTIPTAGILISSLRNKDLIATSGWWTALMTTQRTEQARTGDATQQKMIGGAYVISGNIFDGKASKLVNAFGINVSKPDQYKPGETAKWEDGRSLSLDENGNYIFTMPNALGADENGQRIFFRSAAPPSFTMENYKTVLSSEGVGRAFFNSLTVAIPSTIIPLSIAAFAAYALAWMKMPFRGLFISTIIGMLVIPLQMSLIPLLRLYNDTGAALGISPKGYLGIWLAHTGFGLPFAIYLLRSYIAGLPKDLIESAQIDGASDFKIFLRIVMPLSLPAFASLAIFQFLWVWNDLLVAIVFLGTGEDQLVLTGKLNGLLGSRGGNWEILTASAFITIIVPLCVFFGLQRYFVRGLLAGSVKGG